ncbi:MAG: GatB/YqeY domain-containing protein [Thiohalobacteraceae bacterium]
MSLKAHVREDMKAAMRSGDKRRLGVIRLILAAITQREVDERIELDAAQTLAVLDKMLKQRRESLTQYEQAGRTDLAEQEGFEIGVIQAYLPQPLTPAEVDSLIAAAIATTGAAGIKDMGKVMAILKPKLQGRADMGAVSGQIKVKLGG